MASSLAQLFRSSLPQEIIESVIAALGYCHECGEGLIAPVRDGFGMFVLDGKPSHWFCRCCGSSDVTVARQWTSTILSLQVAAAALILPRASGSLTSSAPRPTLSRSARSRDLPSGRSRSHRHENKEPSSRRSIERSMATSPGVLFRFWIVTRFAHPVSLGAAGHQHGRFDEITEYPARET